MQGVTGARRWSKQSPCPICGGCSTDPRGKERRCIGFLSGDGKFIHCSREERAGGIQLSPKSETYGHLREGNCGCGSTHNEPPARAARGPNDGPRRHPELPPHDAQYRYVDEQGKLEFVVLRTGHGAGKKITQRRPDGSGGWWDRLSDAAGVLQVRRVLYRLPELLRSEPGEPIYITEGEKAADAIRGLGAEATCSPHGAGKWALSDERARRAALTGRHVVILPDNDGPGRSHASQVAADVFSYAASIRVLALPGLPDKGDAYDWLAAGGTIEQLEALRQATPRGADIGGVTVGHGSSDVPPGVAADPAAAETPFEVEFGKALEDVKRALDNGHKVDRKPLFVDVADLFKREYPPTPWRVTGIVTRGGLALLAAEPKSCKTWFGTEMAVAVATGTKVCGEFFAERGTVAYFYAEDLDIQIRNRVRALAVGRGLDPATIRGLHVCPRGEFIDVTRNEDLAHVIASCRMIGKVDMVVLDPLSDIHSGEEDKRDSMREVMRRLRLIGELLDCTVVVAHHKGKASKDSASRRPGQTMRGSGVIHGSTDSGIYFGIRGGDDVAKFELGVDVELKGARSAGFFTATIEIEDDGAGQAIKATWTIDRTASKKKPGSEAAKDRKSASDDFKVIEFIRQLVAVGTVLSRRGLCNYENPELGPQRPFSDTKMRAVIDRLLDAGRLAHSGGVVQLADQEPNE